MGSKNVWIEVSCISDSEVLTFDAFQDPPDDELRAAFEQFSREKSGSGLSGDEQLIRLNTQFPELDIRCVSHAHFRSSE
jgi:hypothetical protein